MNKYIQRLPIHISWKRSKKKYLYQSISSNGENISGYIFTLCKNFKSYDYEVIVRCKHSETIEYLVSVTPFTAGGKHS